MKIILKKIRLCLLASISLFFVACSNSEKLSGDEFLIEGKIDGVENGAVITLFRRDGDTGATIATDTLKNNRFRFKIEAVSNPEKMDIMCFDEGYPSSNALSFWVAPGKRIKITGKDKMLTAWTVKSYIPYQKEQNLYSDKSRNIIWEMARLAVEYNDLRTKVRSSPSEEDANKYRKNADSIDLIRRTLSVEQDLADLEIMEKYDISPIWLDKMREISIGIKYSKVEGEYTDVVRKKTEVLYNRMSEEDKNTPMGYNITANLFPPAVVGVGDDMADTDFFDTNGNTKHLSDYSGKYLLLDFWSRGCGPCIMALPEMKEISETYADKLTIISISLDTDAAWKEAMTIHDMPWVNIRDPKGMGGLAANYDVAGIPNYVMISPEGKIIDKWMGFGEGYLKRKVSENI